jgi:hypothetical protein
VSETLKVNILSYEYTGYGLYKGQPSEQNCLENIMAAYLHLTIAEAIPPERIILYVDRDLYNFNTWKGMERHWVQDQQ